MIDLLMEKITGPCGDKMEIFLRGRKDKINDISYTTDGCMTSHAAGSAATVMAKGKPVRECIRINQSSILEHLCGMPKDSEAPCWPPIRFIKRCKITQ